MKRIPVLLAASVLLFCCTACDESALETPLLPDNTEAVEMTAPPTASPAPSISAAASDTVEFPTFTPEPTPVSWTLGAQEFLKLRNEVAVPLAAMLYSSQLAGNGMMNYDIPISDLSSYMFDMNATMWQGFFASIADAQIDLNDMYQWIAQQIFPSFQRDAAEDGTWTYTVPTAQAAAYFADAFGPSIPLSGSLTQDADNTTFSCGSGETAPILVPENSQEYEEGYVDNGLVHFPVTYIGADSVVADLVVSLSVVPEATSRYGCNVISFNVAQENAAYVPGTEEPAVTTFDDQGFVFADSSQRYLSPEELAVLSPELLGFARSEIYARHGNVFLNDIYRSHYSQYPWYQELQKRSGVGYEDFNEIEIANVELIDQFDVQPG